MEACGSQTIFDTPFSDIDTGVLLLKDLSETLAVSHRDLRLYKRI